MRAGYLRSLCKPMMRLTCMKMCKLLQVPVLYCAPRSPDISLPLCTAVPVVCLVLRLVDSCNWDSACQFGSKVVYEVLSGCNVSM